MNKRVALLLNTGKEQYDEKGYVETIAVCSIPISADIAGSNIFNNLKDFIDYEFNKNRRDSEIIYVENLSSSGVFIMNYLNQDGYSYSREIKLENIKDYSVVMSSGQIYQIKILVSDKPRRFINFYDINKAVPLNQKELNKGFDLNIRDYDESDIYNERNIKTLLSNTIEYVKVMKYIIDMDLDGITLSSRAFSKLRASVPRYSFMYKPTEEKEYDFIHGAYNAGYNDIDDLYKGKELTEVLSLDVNSMYPSILRNSILPFGVGVYYEGKCEPSKLYPLYIQRIRISGADVKYGKTAMLNPYIGAQKAESKYIDNIEGREITLSNVMLDLFLDNYYVYDIEYLDGYKYSAKQGSFENFVDEWMDIKIRADRAGDKAIRTIAKMVMNFSYGGFGKRRIRNTDYFNENGKTTEKVEAMNRYMPIAIFITSYAIKDIVDIKNCVGERFIYADVDSMHLLGHEIPEVLKDRIHSDKLGYWGIEGKFNRAKYLKLKTYIQENDEVTVIKTAGAGDEIKEQMNFNNFNYGNEFDGMIRTKRVEGGTIKEILKYNL